MIWSWLFLKYGSLLILRYPRAVLPCPEIHIYVKKAESPDLWSGFFTIASYFFKMPFRLIPPRLRKPMPRRIMVTGPGLVEPPITIIKKRSAVPINPRIKDLVAFNMAIPLFFLSTTFHRFHF
jgi:hypothetical protein